VHHYFFDKSPNETSVSVGRLADIDVKMHVLSHTTFLWFIYATADEADAYMFYRCFFLFFFAFSIRHKKLDNRSWERLNGFS